MATICEWFVDDPQIQDEIETFLAPIGAGLRLTGHTPPLGLIKEMQSAKDTARVIRVVLDTFRTEYNIQDVKGLEEVESILLQWCESHQKSKLHTSPRR